MFQFFSRAFFLSACLCAFLALGSFCAFAKEGLEKKSSAPARVFDAKTFTLDNGLSVVVIPSTRVPLVTHMLWIRSGGADEPESLAGVAHYLEHLMFKGTPKIGPGEYSRRIRAVGGSDNAFTGQDYTSYFVTLAPEHLESIMAMEADRFAHLAPPTQDASSERDVILEERRQRTENDPLGLFQEQMIATLFSSHAYANPVIGWMEDMKRLTWADAQAFKDRWYVPGNMTLIVSGDVTPEQVRTLAQRYYGGWEARPVPVRQRLTPPMFPAAVTLDFPNAPVRQSSVLMAWRVPSARQNKADALALEVLQEALDGGASTRLYQDLVVRHKRASALDFSYDGSAWDEGTVWMSATPAPGVSLEDLRTDLLAALSRAAKDLSDTEVREAIARIQQQAIFARDSVMGPAMIVGQGLASGLSLEDIETWPAQIGAVTPEAVRAVLSRHLVCAPGPACQPPLTGFVRAGAPDDRSPALPAPSPKGIQQ